MSKGEQVPYQVTYDDKLIFPATVAANASAAYTVQAGTPVDVEVRACGRQYPERLDDMAWENDLVGFRAYGPALQARGERGFGYELVHEARHCCTGTGRHVCQGTGCRLLEAG